MSRRRSTSGMRFIFGIDTKPMKFKGFKPSGNPFRGAILMQQGGALPKYQNAGTITKDSKLTPEQLAILQAAQKATPQPLPKPAPSTSSSKQIVIPKTPQQKSTEYREQMLAEQRFKGSPLDRIGNYIDKEDEFNTQTQAINAVDKGTPFTFPDGTQKTYNNMDFRERGYVSGQALRRRAKWDNDDIEGTAWYNPVAMLYDMAAGLGEAPYKAKQQDSYTPYITSIGIPLVTGALGSLGAKTTGQFVNNLANPFAGTGDLVNNLGNKYLPNAYKYNPWALKENPEMLLYRARPVGQNPDMNMAAQLKAKEAAGEPLKWYQKNLLNPQTNPEIIAREKYYGRWFEKDPSRLDFYINPETRNFADNDAIEILRTRLPKTEAAKLNVSQFDDAKLLSASPETEFILPKNIISSAERFPESSWQKLIQEDRYFNTPHWLKGFKQKGGVIIDPIFFPESKKYIDNINTKFERVKNINNQEEWINNWYNNKLKNFQPVSTPTQYKDIGNTAGKVNTYIIENKRIPDGVTLNPNNINRKTDYLHEKNHYYQNLNPKIFNNINNVLNNRKVYNNSYNTSDFNYLTDPLEIHSRLMEFRYDNNIKPNQKVKKGDIDLKQLQKYNLDIFQEDEFIDILNKIVSNSKSQNLQIAQKGGVIIDPMGQWRNPYQETIVPTQDGRITMRGVNYPLLGIDETGYTQVMFPNEEHQFPGKIVYEKPLVRNPYKMQQGGFSLEQAYKFLFDDEEENNAPVTAPSESELEELKQEQFLAGQKEAAKKYAKELRKMKNNEAVMQLINGNPELNFDNFISGQSRNTSNKSLSTYPSNSNYSNVNLGKTADDRAKQMMNYLQQNYNLPKHVAAGITGNAAMESSFGDKVLSGQKWGDNGNSFGLFQWNGQRNKDFFNWAKQNNRNPYDMYTQIDFGVYEAKQRGDLQAVSKAQNATQAANIWRDRFERPAVKDNKRAQYANKFMNFQIGGTYDVDPITLLELKRKGYKYKII